VNDPNAEWFGEYEILRLLATGPRWDTLLARAHGPGGFRRAVLVKRYALPADESETRELAREARALARVSGPCVVQLHGFSRIQGRPLLVLEYVPGPTLAEAARALPALTDEVMLYIGHALFSGLATAHEACDLDTGEAAPVVHRNVHPGNVRLAWTGDVKLTGFAMAKRLVGDDATYPGRPRGTYGYMAPEQVLAEQESARTDVYSAALVVYELLARRRAFDVGAMPELELLKAMAYPSLPPLASLRPDLDPSLCRVMDLALAPDPGVRRASASAMATVLGSMIGRRWARQACAEALAPMRADPSWHATPRAPSATVSSDLPSEPDRTERFLFDEVPVPRSVRPSTISLPVPATSTPPARPRATRLRRWVALSAATVALALLALLARRPLAVFHRAPKTAEGPAPNPPSAAHAGPSVAIDRTPPQASRPSSPPSASAPLAAPPPSPTRGTLLTPPRAASHRIYVDGRVIGEGHRSFEVRCGVRLVRVGSAGRDQRVVVPCGGSIAVP
jgi:serine/threonine protein kinase